MNNQSKTFAYGKFEQPLLISKVAGNTDNRLAYILNSVPLDAPSDVSSANASGKGSLDTSIGTTKSSRYMNENLVS